MCIWPRGSQQNLNLVIIHFWSLNLYMYWFGAAQALITSFNTLDLELCTHLSCKLRPWLSLKWAIIKTYNYSPYTRSFCSILYSSPLLVLLGYKPLQRWWEHLISETVFVQSCSCMFIYDHPVLGKWVCGKNFALSEDLSDISPSRFLIWLYYFIIATLSWFCIVLFWL